MRLTLRTKLLFSVGFIIFLVLGISTGMYIRKIRQDYLQAIEWRAEALAHSILQEIQTYVEYYDEEDNTAEQFYEWAGGLSLQCLKIYELNQEKDVTHVAVINNEQIIVSHNDTEQWNTPVEAPELLKHLGKPVKTRVLVAGVYHMLIPILGSHDFYLGAVDIGIDKEAIDGKIRDMLVQSGVLFIVFVVVALLVLSALLHLLVIRPVKRITTIGEKIARGEVTAIEENEKQALLASVTDSHDEIGRLLRVFHDMLHYLQDIAGVARHISEGNVQQRIEPRSEKDALGVAFHNMTTYLANMAAVATAISEGDLQQHIAPKTGHDALGNALSLTISRLNTFLREMEELVSSVAEGKLEVRAHTEEMTGVWRELLSETNELIDAFVTPITVTAEYLDRMSKGDIPEQISESYKGDFNEIKNNLNLLIDSMYETTRIAEEIAGGNLAITAEERSSHDRLMKALNVMILRLNAMRNETDRLIQAVQAGELTIRGDSQAFEGGWRDLVEGINALIDAFVMPVTLTARYLDRLSKGDIPEQIVEEYHGDFNAIKQNLNLLIRSTNEVNQIAEAIAAGNVNVEITERSEHDRLMTALQDMVTRLHRFLSDMDTLVKAVTDGKLEVRADTSEMAGGWRRLMEGTNTLIDAFVAPINVTAEYLDRLSKGDLPEQIRESYNGDFNEIKNTLNLLIDATHETTRIAEEIASGNLEIEAQERSSHDRLMKALNDMILRLNAVRRETDTLIRSVQDGNLDIRGDAEAFEGGWRELVEGINTVIEAFVGPFNMTADVIARIVRGNSPDTLTGEFRGDFNEIKNNLNLLIESMHEITRLAEEMAAGNLMLEVRERSDEDTLMQALNSMLLHLKNVVLNVQETARVVSRHSQDLSGSAESISEGATRQAAAAQQVSSSMEQMTSNISQNADNAKQTEKIAIESAEYAEEGGKVIAETVVVMQQISDKILIIQEIAMQTRLLSLNATIEAARAQEHGKAFSVVASEVRKLSDITKKAAEEIDRLASSSLEVSQKAGEMLNTLVPSIHKTAGLVQEISAASTEQRAGSEQITFAIQQLDQVTQQNVATVQGLATAAQELASQAQQLEDAISFFKVNGVSFSSDEQRTSPQFPQEISHKEEQHDRREDDKKTPEDDDFQMFDMDAGPPPGDERDAEFEKY